MRASDIDQSAAILRWNFAIYSEHWCIFCIFLIKTADLHVTCEKYSRLHLVRGRKKLKSSMCIERKFHQETPEHAWKCCSALLFNVFGAYVNACLTHSHFVCSSIKPRRCKIYFALMVLAPLGPQNTVRMTVLDESSSIFAPFRQVFPASHFAEKIEFLPVDRQLSERNRDI